MTEIVIIVAIVLSGYPVNRRRKNVSTKNPLWIELTAVWLVAFWIVVLVPILTSWLGVSR